MQEIHGLEGVRNTWSTHGKKYVAWILQELHGLEIVRNKYMAHAWQEIGGLDMARNARPCPKKSLGACKVRGTTECLNHC